MIECTTCGAQGEASFSTNYFGELVCELCGTQSFLQSRNETQDMEDTNLDVMRTSTMKRTLRGAASRGPSGGADNSSNSKQLTRRGTGRRMKRRGDSASLLDCLRATQTVLDYQARALQQLGGFPDEFLGAVEQIWFLFLETWERKSARPLLRCFTEFFVPLRAADKAMDPALTQQLLEQWDADRAAEAAGDADDTRARPGEAGADASAVVEEPKSERVSASTGGDGEEEELNDDKEEDEGAGDLKRQGDTRAPKRKAAQGAVDSRRKRRPTTTTTRIERTSHRKHASASLAHFSIVDLLGILVLAARTLNLGVLPCDVAYWVATGELPFHNLLSVCSPELQAAVYNVSLFFESTISGNRVTASLVAYRAQYLQHHLELPLPPLNVSLVAYTICANVGFPPQVFRHFQWLTAHFNVKGELPGRPLLQHQRRTDDDDDSEQLVESAVGIAAHIAVAVKMTANWHEWIYEQPAEPTRRQPPYRVQDARELPRRDLDAFVDFYEDALIGRDRANIPSGFESHVYDLRGKYSERSHQTPASSAVERLTPHQLLVYPAVYVNGVCDEQDEDIEARIASIKQRTQTSSVKDETANDDVFFYPFYARNVKFPVLHAAYESVLERLCAYIDAPIATVLSVTEQLDREVHAACKALEANSGRRREPRDEKALTTCAQAIKAWEAKNNLSGEEAAVIKLYCQVPPIAKLDNSLNTLKNCEQLSLSTNCIDRLIPLSGMKKLRILSLGRNQLKKIEKLDDVSDTLEELWVSYNAIATLDGLAGLANLTTLYLSNNLVKSWDELDKLANLPKLRDVLFVGNPIYENLSKEEQRLNVLKRIPKVAKIDGDMVKQTERDAAMGQ